MKISEAKGLLGQIIAFNMEQAVKGQSDNTFLVPFFRSSPGCGKTALVRQVAREMKIEYQQAIIAQFDAGELAGLPFVNKEQDEMIRLRPHYLPPAPDKLQNHNAVGLFNLDELPQAFLANQNIASQLVNEWRVGEHLIPLTWSICCTGNRAEDKAGTVAMPAHLKDRLMFIDITVDPDEWLGYAAERKIDPRIRAYIKQNSARLNDFKPGSDKNPTPRSWEKVSAILSLDLTKGVRSESIAAQIGDGDATTFEAWIRVEDKMPKWQDIVANPKTAPVFDQKQADILYMLLATLVDRCDEKNLAAMVEYVNRLPKQEFAVYFMTDLLKQKPALAETREVRNWKLKVGAHLLV
jgi:hypothetical protein